MSILDNDTQVSVLVDGLDHPEGIAWGLDGYAYAGGEAGQLYRIDIEESGGGPDRRYRRLPSGPGTRREPQYLRLRHWQQRRHEDNAGRSRIGLFERHGRRAVPCAELRGLRR